MKTQLSVSQVNNLTVKQANERLGATKLHEGDWVKYQRTQDAQMGYYPLRDVVAEFERFAEVGWTPAEALAEAVQSGEVGLLNDGEFGMVAFDPAKDGA